MKTIQYSIEEKSKATLIKLAGNIDGVDAFELKEKLKRYASKQKDLSIDLTEVDEISLTGLNSILISKAYANSQDNKMTLVINKDSKILKHLHLTKMTDQFIIEITGNKN